MLLLFSDLLTMNILCLSRDGEVFRHLGLANLTYGLTRLTHAYDCVMNHVLPLKKGVEQVCGNPEWNLKCAELVDHTITQRGKI